MCQCGWSETCREQSLHVHEQQVVFLKVFECGGRRVGLWVRTPSLVGEEECGVRSTKFAQYLAADTTGRAGIFAIGRYRDSINLFRTERRSCDELYDRCPLSTNGTSCVNVRVNTYRTTHFQRLRLGRAFHLAGELLHLHETCYRANKTNLSQRSRPESTRVCVGSPIANGPSRHKTPHGLCIFGIWLSKPSHADSAWLMCMLDSGSVARRSSRPA